MPNFEVKFHYCVITVTLLFFFFFLPPTPLFLAGLECWRRGGTQPPQQPPVEVPELGHWGWSSHHSSQLGWRGMVTIMDVKMALNRMIRSFSWNLEKQNLKRMFIFILILGCCQEDGHKNHRGGGEWRRRKWRLWGRRCFVPAGKLFVICWEGF